MELGRVCRMYREQWGDYYRANLIKLKKETWQTHKEVAWRVRCLCEIFSCSCFKWRWVEEQKGPTSALIVGRDQTCKTGKIRQTYTISKKKKSICELFNRCVLFTEKPSKAFILPSRSLYKCGVVMSREECWIWIWRYIKEEEVRITYWWFVWKMIWII